MNKRGEKNHCGMRAEVFEFCLAPDTSTSRRSVWGAERSNRLFRVQEGTVLLSLCSSRSQQT